jgi:hypothetical protein
MPGSAKKSPSNKRLSKNLQESDDSKSGRDAYNTANIELGVSKKTG